MSRRDPTGDAHAVVTSRQNPLVKQAREAPDGRDKDSIFVEGLRLCEEAARAGLSVEEVLFTKTLSDGQRGSQLLDAFKSSGARLVAVSEGVLESIADTKSPQGIVLLARRPRAGLEEFEKGLSRARGVAPLVVVLHRAANPSNAGAMLRVAEAAGASAVVSTRHTVDLFSPKALRGSMGSAFRLPLWAGAELGEVLSWCAASGIKTVSTSAGASRSHTELDWTTPAAVVVGAESSGLEAEEVAATDASIKIPMRPTVESLNVATALAVVLYEAARQRGFECMDG